MGAGHGHHSGARPNLDLGRWPKLTVIGLIVLSGLAALLGVFSWWPDGERVDSVRGLIPFAVEGLEVVHGELVDVIPACTGLEAEGDASCGSSSALIEEGPSTGKTVPIALSPDVLSTGLAPGDRVLLFDPSGVQGAAPSDFSFYRADRGQPMIWLAIIFALAVILVAWRRGLMALVSLGFAGVVVIGFLLPSLLSGQPAVPVTLAASTLILIVMLYATHGISMRTSVALLGALLGVAISTGFAWFGVIGSRLAGLGDEAAGLLGFNVEWISLQHLVVASVILAGLGTLNDVTITQVSALWELRGASPGLSRWELFRRAMRIGRDHVASTVYTLIFAYLGTALVLLVAVQLQSGTPFDFLTAEDVAEEIVRALVGGIALVLAMPLTTAIGILVIAGATPVGGGGGSPSASTAETGSVGAASAGAGENGEGRRRARDAFRRLPDNPWSVD